jgi:hypothetical protein
LFKEYFAAVTCVGSLSVLWAPRCYRLYRSSLNPTVCRYLSEETDLSSFSATSLITAGMYSDSGNMCRGVTYQASVTVTTSELHSL